MVVEQGQIVEISYLLPGGRFKVHPALVVSVPELQNEEDGMFYAVLISTENIHPQYTIKIEPNWLNRPMEGKSYFVTHIMNYFQVSQITKNTNTFVKKRYLDHIIAKVINSIFGWEVEV